MSYAPTGFRVDLEVSGSWTDITSYVLSTTGVSLKFGRTSPLGQPQVASASFTLKNSDGRFTPKNAAGAYYPAVAPRSRVRVSYSSGTNKRFVGYIKGLTPQLVGGTLPVVQVDAVCRLGQLSQITVGTAYDADVLADNPIIYYPLSDPNGSLLALDASGNSNEPLQVVLGPDGTPPTFGVGFLSITPPVVGADAQQFVRILGVDDVPDGTSLGGYLAAGNVTALQTYGTSMLSGATLEMICGVVELPAVIETALNVFRPLTLDVIFAGDGCLYATNFFGSSFVKTASSVVGQMLHVAIPYHYTAGTLFFSLYVNGSLVGSTSEATTSHPTDPPYQMTVGAGNDLGWDVLHGMVAGVAVYNSELSSTRIASHANAFLATAEASGARIARHLALGGLTTSDWNLGTGNESIAAQATKDKTIATLVEDVITSEGGGAVAFTDTDGRIRFNDANYRTTTSVVLTLDAQVDLPIETWAPFFDDLTRINRSIVNNADNTVSATYSDQASITALGLISETVTTYSASDTGPSRLAQYRVNTSKSDNRFPQLVVDLARTANYTTLFAALPNVTIGSRIRISNIPKSFTSVATGGSAMRIFHTDTIDLYVEGWSEQVADDTYRLTFDVSPADVPGARGVWDAGVWVPDSMTLHTTVTSGSTTVVIDVAPILSVSGGDYPQKIKIDEEVMTVTACSGGSSPQTLTVTRASAGTFADAHTSGATVSFWPGSVWTM